MHRTRHFPEDAGPRLRPGFLHFPPFPPRQGTAWPGERPRSALPAVVATANIGGMATSVQDGLRAPILGMLVNILLAAIKITTGVVGHSYALVADGIESCADILSSLIVWGGLKFSLRPADQDHPYGHGKAEAVAGLVVALALLGAAVLIAVQSVKEILTPHHAPAWFTLPVLLLVILAKEMLSRRVLRTADALASTALKGDAWHHRSDALTSAAAFVGISIALIGGEGYESADDWAALLACGVIGFNGLKLVQVSVQELMDAAPADAFQDAVRVAAAKVEGVRFVEKCRVRKYGLRYVADLHVEVDGSISVREGHRIAHDVKDALLQSDLRLSDVLVHVEPVPDLPPAPPSPAAPTDPVPGPARGMQIPESASAPPAGDTAEAGSRAPPSPPGAITSPRR